jgi:superoxide dismutase, Fe-Mn family
MKKVSRREAITKVVAGGAGLALLGHAGAEAAAQGNAAQAQAAAAARAFRGQHQPKPLPFDPAKLKGLSEKLIRSHWENNYGGSVKALNAVEQRLDAMAREKDLPPYVYGDLKREELHRTGSVVLHEHYFANLGGDNKPGGEVLDAVKEWFGSYEAWEAEFKKTAQALGGGSGWAMLAYNLHTGEVRNYWAWDHMHNPTMGRPLLVLDMYEHSYHMDYGAAAAKYVDAFMANVNWEEVNRRFVGARKMAALI